MKKSWIMCAALGAVLFLSTGAFSAPWMSEIIDDDYWEPHRTYKNYAGACAEDPNEVDWEDGDNWDVGLCRTRGDDHPVNKRRCDKWRRNKPVDFELTFTKETGLAEFSLNGELLISHMYDEYAGRGMQELRIAAKSWKDYIKYWSRVWITDLTLYVDGEVYVFGDIIGWCIFTYATIHELECNDFVLTGTLHCDYSGKPKKKYVHILFQFGEACEIPAPPPPEPTIDMNDDCIINFAEYAILAAHWLDSCLEPNWCGGSDVDQSNGVDVQDLVYILEEWGNAHYGGGCGTAESPYLIYTDKQLNRIGTEPNDWGAHFRLMADIDLSEYTGNSFNMIGDPNLPFTGVFEGNEYSIIRFTQGDGDGSHIGLFRYVSGADAVIKDLTMIKPNVASEGPDYAGAIVGRMDAGAIYRCYVDQGSVAGYGGLTGTVGADYVGGMVGFSGGSIVESSSTAKITGYNYAGGLVGWNEGSIEKSFAKNENDIYGHDNVGGLVGWNPTGVISDSYAQMPIFAHDYVGGLIGQSSNSEVYNCYSVGYVSENSDYRGGMIGYMHDPPLPHLNNSFWDVDIGSANNDNYLGTPETTSAMQSQATFTSAGWDFSSPVWVIEEGLDYPVLFWQVIPQPNPMEWLLPPVAVGPYTVMMTAVVGYSWDGNNGVEYYFHNVTDPNHDSGWQDSYTYTDLDLEAETEYTYQVKIRDKSSNHNEGSYSSPESATTFPPDTTPPSPSPMEWVRMPDATGEYTVIMKAKRASDLGPNGVQYYFHNVTDPNHDSGWRADQYYIDQGLEPNTVYTYQVKARDTSPQYNETDYSSPASTQTFPPDTRPPDPDPMMWASEPNAVDAYSVAMTAVTAIDPEEEPVQYYFHNVTDPNHDSNWQNSETYVDTGLEPNTVYTYQVKARDKSAQYNESDYSSPASVTTPVDLVPPSPDPMEWESAPDSSGTESIIMTAATATDEAGVQYYFHNVTDPNHDSGWQDSATYEDMGLITETIYAYQVKARDKSANLNETAYSAEALAMPQAIIPPVEYEWTFVSEGSQDGRLWDDGAGNGDGFNDDMDGDTALRLGDFSTGLGYKSIMSFDTSFLPDDSEVIWAKLEMTRGYMPLLANDPFDWPGSCVVDVIAPYFGSIAGLENSDWEAVATATAIATFDADPGQDMPMLSSEFSEDGRNAISPTDTTQVRVYFTYRTDDDNVSDYLGFYSGEYEDAGMRPKLTVRYMTQERMVELPSIASEDGRGWDMAHSGEGIGNQVNFAGDTALRIGDFSGTEGYRSFVSFDTSVLPFGSTVTVAMLRLTRGADTGVNPFTGWGGDCIIDIAKPYFGDSSDFVISDYEAAASAVDVARFLEDTGRENPMESTLFNSAGLNNINPDGRTQLRFYFTNSTNDDLSTDYVGFYAGECPIEEKRPTLIIRYLP